MSSLLQMFQDIMAIFYLGGNPQQMKIAIIFKAKAIGTPSFSGGTGILQHILWLFANAFGAPKKGIHILHGSQNKEINPLRVTFTEY